MSGIHWQFGVVQNQATSSSGGGGGGTIPFTIAVDASSGANNAMTGALHNPSQSNPNGNIGVYIDFADGTSGTSAGQSTYGTASSPTRTTQTAHVRTSEVAASYNNTPQFSFFFFFGGYIRQGNMGTLSNIHWQIPSSVTTSLSNGTSVFQSAEVSDVNEHNQNNILVDGPSTNSTNFNFIPQGIYGSMNKSIGSAFYTYNLTWGGGRGTPTFPAVNDTISFIFEVDADISGTTHTVMHEFIIKFI
tara:strand:+ start:382 stop:1119 length:738 start_codon:yes stop_codon:yes gene_type:complete